MGVHVPEAVMPVCANQGRHILAIRCDETRGFPGDRHLTTVAAADLTALVLSGTGPGHARQSVLAQHSSSPAATVADKPSGKEFRNIP